MSPTLATIIGGLAVAAITGVVSWIVATSRALGRVEAAPISPPKLAEIEKILTEIRTRLETEEKYRWPQQDKIMAEVTGALKDVDRALRALIDSRARPAD